MTLALTQTLSPRRGLSPFPAVRNIPATPGKPGCHKILAKFLAFKNACDTLVGVGRRKLFEI
jgi:hypothetical protein